MLGLMMTLIGEIATIVISVDDFSSFTERFGALIGDVILSKIAKKSNQLR